MYKDEEIAEARLQAKRKKYTGIDTGIYSDGELLEFCEMKLFQNKVGIVLPVTFEDMTQEDAKKKYPSEQRPQIIKTNQNGTINFTFNLINQKMETGDLEAAVHDFVRVLKRLHPTSICLKIEKGQGVTLPYASLEFTSTAVNENLYNMLIVSSIGEELLMLLFNCPFDKRNEWTSCLMQIRERLADYSKEETNAAN